jgi:hypothetical protein
VSVVVVIACLIAAAVAYAGAGRSFRGRTSQKQPISFMVAGGHVRKLDYRILDTCPGGLRLINHDFGFSPIPIARARFGGTFLDPAHHAKAVLAGSLKNGVVRGSITDRTRSATTHKICTGKATFTLHPR